MTSSTKLFSVGITRSSKVLSVVGPVFVLSWYHNGVSFVTSTLLMLYGTLIFDSGKRKLIVVQVMLEEIVGKKSSVGGCLVEGGVVV